MVLPCFTSSKRWVPRAKGLCCAALLLQLAGCAGAELGSADSVTGMEWGGQTGSLIPDLCSGQSKEPSQVVTGDVAFASSQEVDSAILADSMGQQIAVSAEPMGERGATVLRTEMALTQGQYVLIAECATGSVQQIVQVGEAAPLPEALGSLTLADHPERCDQSPWLDFALELDPKAIPYAALLELSVKFDSGPEWVWVPFGALPQPGEDEPLVLPMERCGGDTPRMGCAPRTETKFVVTARIAGETEALPVVELPFDGRCTVKKEEPTPACEVTSHAKVISSPARGALPLLGIGVLALLCVRRRRSRGAPLANRQ